MTEADTTRTGAMSEIALGIPLILQRMWDVGAGAEVVWFEGERRCVLGWPEIRERTSRLIGLLDGLVSPGGRVASFAWSTGSHVELYFGVPCSGRVLHTINVRLHPSDIEYLLAHAEDELVFVEASLSERLSEVRSRLGSRVQFVVVEDGGEIAPAFSGDSTYEELLEGARPCPPADPLPERTPAVLCYTSGTTGRPKGVLYSHRSIWLHALGALGVDSHAVSRRDTVFAIAPMFHANGWGLPYASALAGAKLVLPGRDHSPKRLAQIIEEEEVSVGAGVPTVWRGIAAALEEDGAERGLRSLSRILCSGEAVPAQLIETWSARGVAVLELWGMTEMSPSGSSVERRAADAPEQLIGRPQLPVAGVELSAVGEDGKTVPRDGKTAGELLARGPWVAAGYERPEGDANRERFVDGWLRTGDLATVDETGGFRIVDRVKDLVKSGGEWIGSKALEDPINAHPAVAEAAVIGAADERWGERPVAIVACRGGATLTANELRSHLEGKVAKWWIPDAVIQVDALPRTSAGKVDKRELRARYRDALEPKPDASGR